MSLAPLYRTHLHPVLKDQGFQKQKHCWVNAQNNNWIKQVEFRSQKYGDGESYVFECDFGFYSRDLDRSLGWSGEVGSSQFPNQNVPYLGTFMCHFESSIFSFDYENRWAPLTQSIFISPGPKAENCIRDAAERLARVLPWAFDTFGSYQGLVEARSAGIGSQVMSKQTAMFTAAACVKLGEYEQAKYLLEVAVRPGSSQFMKRVGARLKSFIDERT